MRELDDDLAERLIDAEGVDSARLASLRKEIRAVVEQKWSKPKRIGSLAGGLFLLCLGIVPLHGALAEPVPLIRLMAVIAMITCIALGAMMIALAWRGSFNRRRHNQLYLLLAFVILGALGITFLNLGWRAGDAQLQFTGALMLALLGFVVVLHFMEQHQLSLTERLLEMELRIVELGERLERSKS